jgi:hypothetical protein
MKKIYMMYMTILFCLLSAGSYAAEKDAAGCSDHPLVPRIQGYYISGCNEIPAAADMDIIRGEVTESVRFEGKSIVFSYMQLPDLKTKPDESSLRGDFENAVKKNNGSLFGVTYGQKWPVYTVVKEGRKFWIILLVNSGKYFNGSYACRIIESR